MPRLVLGPILRYVGETEAVLWVETDEACEVEILGCRQRTFHVEGHHYGVLRTSGLERGAWHEYEVLLDGEKVWPEEGSELPPSRFHTYPKDDPLEIAFGSCRVSAPDSEPWTLTGDEHPRGFEGDALRALAARMADGSVDRWPDVLLLLGDQVYADEVSPVTETFMESRRDLSQPPGRRVWDFEEYTHLYREAWSDPMIRWLYSTVSTAMVFDDHDVHDDWNISQAWLEEMRAEDWWEEHIVGALMSYWIYQHLGNLAPGDQEEDGLLRRVREADDAGPILREFALRADSEPEGARWSFCRDIGDTRLVVIDSRAGRVLEEGRRSMVDEGEWDWIAEHATGGFDHLILASSLPWLLAPGMHHAEAWNEAVAGGAWGARAAKLAERIRQGGDLEHWAAFNDSFRRLAELQRSVGAGERGPAPASITTVSGDVHHAYLFEVGFPKGSEVRSHVWQAVCSPFRNPLERKERRAVRAGFSRPFAAFWGALARAAGVEDPPVRWRTTGGGPYFDNQVATLSVDERRLDFRLEKTRRDDHQGSELECVIEKRLA